MNTVPCRYARSATMQTCSIRRPKNTASMHVSSEN